MHSFWKKGQLLRQHDSLLSETWEFGHDDVDGEFAKPRHFGGRYQNTELENLFVLFNVGHPLVLTLCTFYVPALNISQSIGHKIFVTPLNIIAYAAAIPTLLTGVIHYLIVVRNYQSVKWLNEERISSSVILAAKRHEWIFVVLLVFSALPLLDTYPYVQRCIDQHVSKGWSFWPAQNSCGKQVYIWVPLMQLVTPLVIRCRYFFGMSLLAFPAVFVYPMRWLGPDVDTDNQFVAHLLAVSVMTAFIAVIYVLLEKASRQRFEAVMRLRDAERKALSSRKAIHSTLSSLLPNVERLSRNELLVDVNAECCVSHFRLHDFGRWTTQLTPDTVMCVLEMLVSAFDERCGHLGVDKLYSRGDEYLTTTNLRTAIASFEAPSTTSLYPLYALAAWQLTVLRRTKRKLLVKTPVSGAVGIYTGSVIGILVGTERLAYEVFGEAINVAVKLSKSTTTQSIVAFLRDIPEALQSNFGPFPEEGIAATLWKDRAERPLRSLHLPRHDEIQTPHRPSPSNSASLPEFSEEGLSSLPTESTTRYSNADQQRFRYLRQRVMQLDRTPSMSDDDGNSTNATYGRISSTRGAALVKSATDLDVLRSLAAQRYSTRSSSNNSDGESQNVSSSIASAAVSDHSSELHVLETSGRFLWERYTDPTLEAAFSSFLFARWEASSVAAQLLFLACAALFGLMSVIDTSVALVASLCLLASCILPVIRLFHARAVPKAEQNRRVHFLSIPVALLIMVAPFAMERKEAVLVSRSLFGLLMPMLMVYLEFLNYVAAVQVPAMVSLVVLGFSIHSFFRGFDVLNAVLSLFVLPAGLLWVGMDMERKNRAYFEALFWMDSAKTVALQETALFHALLEMTIPAALRQAVTKKAEGEADYLDVVQWLGDLCTAGVTVGCYCDLNLGDRGVEDILGLIRATADTVDSAFQACSGRLERFATFGDTFFVAGPLKAEEDEDMLNEKKRPPGQTAAVDLVARRRTVPRRGRADGLRPRSADRHARSRCNSRHYQWIRFLRRHWSHEANLRTPGLCHARRAIYSGCSAGWQHSRSRTVLAAAGGVQPMPATI